jgi:hypothetical protein
MRCLLALAVFGFLLGVQLGAPVSAEEVEPSRQPSHHTLVKAPRSGPPAASGTLGKGPGAEDHPPVEPSLEATWTEGEITAAQEECARLLGPLGLTVERAKPLRTGQCGTPAPIVLRRVGAVEIVPPAVVNCRIAAKLSEWMEQKLQPIAREVLDVAVMRIVNASAYTCRQRVASSKDRLSEHSFANALDVSAFVLIDGRTIDVLTHWGATGRDRHAQATLGAGAIGGGQAQPLSDVSQEELVLTRENVFLRRTHEAACGTFSTVLGPEANEAHRNHLHLDLAPRRRKAFCE